MDTELQNFFVTFTTEGLDKVQKDIANLSDKLDAVTKSHKGLDNLTGSLGGFIGKLGLATSAAAVAAAAIKNAFTVGNDALGLKNLAEYAGVSAEKLEQMGIMMKKYGGDWKIAGQDYIKINTVLGELRNRGNLSESMRDVLARYAQYGLRFSPDMSADDVLANLQSVFNKLKARGDNWGIQQIQAAYGISQPTALLLMHSMDQLREEAARARGQLVLSSQETQKNAEALQEAKQELKATWDKLSAQLIPIITDVVRLLSPVVSAVKEFIDLVKGIIKVLTGDISWKDLWESIKKGDGPLGWAANKGEEVGKWIGNKWQENDALESSRNIASGNYTLQDVARVKGWLQDAGGAAYTPEEIKRMNDSLDAAAAELFRTNTPLNSISNTTNNTQTEKITRIELVTSNGTAFYDVNENGTATRTGGDMSSELMPQTLTMDSW